MGEALYPWPVKVWFCDYCDRAIGVGDPPALHCAQASMSFVLAAPEFHWTDEKALGSGGPVAHG